jgi:hypothetical protein
VVKGNTINDNTATRGILQIELKGEGVGVIEGNGFERNAGAVEVNAVKISKSGDKCGGWKIYDNSFKGNVGCAGSVGALVVSCHNEAY